MLAQGFNQKFLFTGKKGEIDGGSAKINPSDKLQNSYLTRNLAPESISVSGETRDETLTAASESNLHGNS
jgi:hypothetical protein